MEWLCGLIGALALVTVVGHGLWVLIALLLRGGRPRSGGSARRVRAGSSEAGEVVRGELARLERQGAISSQVAREVEAALTAEELGLLAEFRPQAPRTSRVPEHWRAPATPPTARPPVPPVPETPTPTSGEAGSSTSTAHETPSPSPPPAAPAVPSEFPVVPPIAPDVSPLASWEQSAEPRPDTSREPQVPQTPPVAVPAAGVYRRPFAPPPPPPRKPLSAVLASFMEEKNIRWGELVGGMLIVLCSAALVVSLWSQIAAIPVLKFFVFTAVTASLFGVGLYTEHRWKLPTTSRGLLITASLLVPLTFLAISAFSDRGAARESFAIPSEVVAIGAFAWLTFAAGKVVTPQWPVLLAASIIGPSAMQLVVRRVIGPEASERLILLMASTPLAFYLGSVGAMVFGASRDEAIDRPRANPIFTLLGIATFAAAMPIGLLVYKSGHGAQIVHQLYLIIALAGVPALMTGLLFWEKVREATLRVAGTSVGVLGIVVMALGVTLAWPQPDRLVPVTLLMFVVLTLVALLFRMPIAQAPAALFLVVAALLLVHVGRGALPWEVASAQPVIRALISGETGTALMPMVVLLAAAGGALARIGRRTDALVYIIAAGVSAALSLALLSLFGLGRSPDFGATWAYLIYGVAALVAAFVVRNRAITSAGAALLLVALIQGMVYRYRVALGFDSVNTAWQTVLPVHASIIAVLAAVVCELNRRRATPLASAIASPLLVWALVVSLAAMMPVLGSFHLGEAGPVSLRLFWIAAIWLIAAWYGASPGVFATFQAILNLAAIVALLWGIADRPWFATSRVPLIAPHTLQAYGITLAGLSLLWAGLRVALSRVAAVQASVHGQKARRLLTPPWPSADRVTLFFVGASLIVLTSFASLAGVMRELSGNPWTIVSRVFVFWIPLLGPATWGLLALLVLTLVVSFWHGFERRTVLMLTLLGVVPCALIAACWYESNGTASALRWTLALYGLLVSLALWFRSPFSRLVTPLSWPRFPERAAGLDVAVRAIVLTISLVLGLVLTVPQCLVALVGESIVGPQDNVFAAMGTRLNYAIPLGILVLMLIGHALRERSSPFAFSAAALLHYLVTLIWLIGLRQHQAPFGRPELIELLQWNVLVAAVFALAWLAEQQWLRRIVVPTDTDWPLLRVQVWLGIIGNAMFILIATLVLIVRPGDPAPELEITGSAVGWAAVLLTIAGATWLAIRRGTRVPPDALCGVGVMLASLIALTMTRFDQGDWLGYHTLLVSYTGVAWITLAFLAPQFRHAVRGLGATIISEEVSPARRAGLIRAITGTIILLVILCIRSSTSDPVRPWWSVGVLAALAVLSATLAWITLLQTYLYVAAFIVGTGTTLWWVIEYPAIRRYPKPEQYLVELLLVNVIASVVPGLCSLFMRRRRSEWAERPALPLLHRLLAALSTMVVGGIVAAGLICDVSHNSYQPPQPLLWIAVAGAWVLTCASLWDLAAGAMAPIAYMLALVTVGALLDRANLAPRWLLWYAAVIVPAWSLLTSAIHATRDRLQGFAAGVGLPDRRSVSGGPPWFKVTEYLYFVLAPALVFAVVFALRADVVQISLTKAATLRILASAVLIFQAMALAVAAGTLNLDRLRMLSLITVAFVAVAIGWSLIEPQGAADLVLNRAVTLMVALATTLSIYGFAFGRTREGAGAWTRVGQTLIPSLLAAAFGTLVFILATEVYFATTTDDHRVPMQLAAIVAVAIALLGLVPVALAFALIPSRDPLKLTENGRTLYVYTAEILLALVFMHIRLTLPELFTGFFERYWPLVVMAIAFVGVGLGEIFRRQNRAVLYIPLERTGALMPMLPVIAFWTLGSRADSEVHYSLQLIIVGALYALLAVRRRSFGYGVLAALAGNGGLWYMLHRMEGYGLFEHPQLWLIPFALSILVGGYLNRDRLTAAQMASLRYVSMSLIYLSSTIEIFLNGVNQAPWLPLVLAGLSVAGVLTGIWLRVRSFLFMGSAFLLISLLTMIWHASRDLGWTWLWYVAGIVLGLVIIGLFALFEKKRAQVVQMLDGLKEWHG